jgi:hypothetical protein
MARPYVATSGPSLSMSPVRSPRAPETPRPSPLSGGVFVPEPAISQLPPKTAAGLTTYITVDGLSKAGAHYKGDPPRAKRVGELLLRLLTLKPWPLGRGFLLPDFRTRAAAPLARNAGFWNREVAIGVARFY